MRDLRARPGSGLAGVSPKSPSGSSKASSVGKAQSSNMHTAVASNLSFSTILKKVRGSKLKTSSRKKQTVARDVGQGDRRQRSDSQINTDSYLADSIEEKTAAWQTTEVDRPLQSFLGRIDTEPKSRGSAQRRFEDTFGVARLIESKKESAGLLDLSRNEMLPSNFRGFKEEKRTLLQLKNIIDSRIKEINSELYTASFKKQRTQAAVSNLDNTWIEGNSKLIDDCLTKNKAEDGNYSGMRFRKTSEASAGRSLRPSAAHEDSRSINLHESQMNRQSFHSQKSGGRVSRKSAKEIIASLKKERYTQPAAYLEPSIDSCRKPSTHSKRIPLNIRDSADKACSLDIKQRIKDRQFDDYLTNVKIKYEAWSSKRETSAFEEAATRLKKSRSKSVNIAEVLKDAPSKGEFRRHKERGTPKFSHQSSVQESSPRVPIIKYSNIKLSGADEPEDPSSGRDVASSGSEQRIKDFIRAHY